MGRFLTLPMLYCFKLSVLKQNDPAWGYQLTVFVLHWGLSFLSSWRQELKAIHTECESKPEPEKEHNLFCATFQFLAAWLHCGNMSSNPVLLLLLVTLASLSPSCQRRGSGGSGCRSSSCPGRISISGEASSALVCCLHGALAPSTALGPSHFSAQLELKTSASLGFSYTSDIKRIPGAPVQCVV